MNHYSTTRNECFEATHSWTIKNWKSWLKINPAKSSKVKNEFSVLYSEKFNVPFSDKNGSLQITTWQLKAFAEKDRHGRNSLKLKLVGHNGNTCVPPGTYDIKSEPLVSFHSLVWFGFNWNERPLDNLKAQYPIPMRWPKKNLKINISIKLFVPINIKSSFSDIAKHQNMNENFKTTNDVTEQKHPSLPKHQNNTGIGIENTPNTDSSSKQDTGVKVNHSSNKKKNPKESHPRGNQYENRTNHEPSSSSSFPTAPSLMDVYQTD